MTKGKAQIEAPSSPVPLRAHAGPLAAGCALVRPSPAVREALLWATSQLAASETPRLEAEVLLASVLSWSRARLYTWPDAALTPEQAVRYRELVERRQHGEPLPYLVGVKEFYGLEFQVDRRVLIPRP